MNCMTFGCMSNVTSHLFAKHAGCRRWHCVSCLASVYHNVYLLECFNASASLIHKISRSRRHSPKTTSGTDQAFSVVSIFDMYYHIWYTTRFHSSEMSLEFLLFFYSLCVVDTVDIYITLRNISFSRPTACARPVDTFSIPIFGRLNGKRFSICVCMKKEKNMMIGITNTWDILPCVSEQTKMFWNSFVFGRGGVPIDDTLHNPADAFISRKRSRATTTLNSTKKSLGPGTQISLNYLASCEYCFFSFFLFVACVEHQN